MTNYHRFFWRAVRAYRRALGLPPKVDIGSRARRERAFEQAGDKQATVVNDSQGLVDTLAEHTIPRFQDDRTPAGETMDRLSAVIEDEHAAGRLAFDDLGALFWSLLDRFPLLETIFQSRYPVIIADEQQDASALQDAVVRRLVSSQSADHLR